MRGFKPVSPNLRIAAAVLFLAVPSIAALRAAAVAQARPSQSPPATASSRLFQSLAAQANAARDAQDFDKAVPLFRKALTLQPTWAEGWWSLGTLYYDNNRYALAASAFQKVIALDPRQGTAHAMLGLCQFELGQDASALRNIEVSKSLGIDEDPQLRQVVLYHEGVLLQRAGRFEGAQMALSSLCLSGVKSEELTQTFGMVALRMRDTEPPAAGSTSAEVVAHLGRGACLTAQKDYAAARQEYEFVIANYPHYPYAHYAYGRSLLDAHDIANAVREFQREIAEAPNSVLPRLQIAAAEYKVDSAAGLPYAEEAVRIAPQMPFAHYLLGLLLLDKGEYQKAIPELEIAQKAFPKETRLYWSLSAAYAHVGRPQDAARARAAFARLSQAAGKESGSAQGQSEDAAPQMEMTDGPDATPKH